MQRVIIASLVISSLTVAPSGAATNSTKRPTKTAVRKSPRTTKPVVAAKPAKPTLVISTPTVPPNTSAAAPKPLEFNGCGTGVECTTMLAPLNPAEPNGEKVSLYMTRRRATKPELRLGTLFINPGGPGGPAYDLVRNSHLFLTPEVLERYDVVGVDPRGTERSSPLVCEQSVGSASSSRAGVNAEDSARQTSLRLAESCKGERGLDFLDTPTAAADLDAVRIALGEPKLNFLGFSYGTYLGAVYETLFPSTAGRIILDSAITPSRFGLNVLIDKASASEVALDGFLAACANGALSPCPFNDGTNLSDRFNRVRASIRSTSLRSFDSSVQSLVGFPRNGWPVLARALQEVAATGRGNFNATAADNLQRDDRERALPVDTFGELANVAINCRDGILPRDPDSYAVVSRQVPIVAPRFAAMAPSFAQASVVCASWPAGNLPTTQLRPVAGVSTLVIGNRFDLTTPIAWSQQLASDLGAPILIREGGGHGAADKSVCVRDVITHFLIDQQPTVPTTTCAL